MKKMKAAAIAILGLTALVALPSCAKGDGTNSSESSEVITYYNVVLPSSVNGAYVAADKTSNLVEGEEVKLTVVLTDSDEYTLESVKVGETLLTGTADANNANILNYTFNMPASDATVTVTTAKVLPVVKAHAITAVGEHVVFTSLPQRADADEVVEFSVSVESGYNVTSVTATSGENEVTLSGSLAAGYSFKMPAGDVEIKAVVAGNIVVLSEDTTEIVVPNIDNSDTFNSDLNDVIFSYINEGTEYETSSSDKFFIRGGTEVTLKARHHNSTLATAFYVDGEKLTADALTEEEIAEGKPLTYTFTMPYHDAKITADHIIRNVNVKTEASNLITTEVYTKDSEGNKVTLGDNKVDIQSEVYVYAKVADNVDAIINSVRIEYDYYETKTSLVTKKGSKLSTSWDSEAKLDSYSFGFVDANTKVFRVPSVAYAGDVTVTFDILTPEFAQQPICGTFKGYEYYQTSSNPSSLAKEFAVDSYGRITSSPVSYVNGGLVKLNEDGTYTASKGTQSRKVYVNGDFMVMAYTKSLDDVYFMTKRDFTDGDLGARINKSSQGNLTCQLYLKSTNEVLETIYTNKEADKVYFGVTIEFAPGTTEELSNTAQFTVKKDGRVLASTSKTLPQTDAVADLAFIGKTYKTIYVGDRYGEPQEGCWMSFTFNADNTLLFSGLNGGGYDFNNKAFDYSYIAQSKQILFLCNDALIILDFSDDFSSLTGAGVIKEGYSNKHNIVPSMVFTPIDAQ